MSNTYFELKKDVTTGEGMHSYTNKYRLSLTAFVGGKNHVQLTVSCLSTVSNMTGTSHIVLSDEDIDNLIGGLIERRAGLITATGNEQSHFLPSTD